MLRHARARCARGPVLVTGRSVKGWQVVPVAMLIGALAVTGCGGGPSADRSAPASTSAAQGPAAASGYEVGNIKATVSGREVVGQCVGRKTDALTVLLEPGMGAPRGALGVVEEHLMERTQVCSYDRAGKGGSDPASKPRPVSEVISDAHAFLAQAAKQGAPPPYFLVGQSFGGEVVFLYAQAHPDQVAGFVSINPGPPYKTWLRRARTVQTEAEIREFELPGARGENEEGIDARSDESMLTDPLPADLPYAVMFDEVCEGLPPPLQNKQDCTRMLRLLELTAKDLAKVGKGGRYVRVKGAGHDIQFSKPEVVLATVDQVWTAAGGR
jgi:pimeloyl-ACP methyl ester carboxylesterase